MAWILNDADAVYRLKVALAGVAALCACVVFYLDVLQGNLAKRDRMIEQKRQSAERAGLETLRETEKEQFDKAIAAANQSALEAQKHAADAENRLLPRRIVSPRREQIIDSLRDVPTGKIYLTHLLVGKEPQAFADDIGETLAAAGFQVTNTEMKPLTLPLDGVFICVRDTENYPAFASLLQQKFDEAGIEMGGLVDPAIMDEFNVPKDAIVIAVGASH